MSDSISYKPYIALILIVVGIFILEGVMYGDEVMTFTQEQFGITDLPNLPISITDILGWFTFFIRLIGFIVSLLFVALTLPIDSIPSIVRIIIVLPIWIIVIILLYNLITKFLVSIGAIIPFTIILNWSDKNDKRTRKK